MKIRSKFDIYSVNKVFLRFDLVTWFLTLGDPYLNLSLISLRRTIWQGLAKIQLKPWHLELLQDFYLRFDLVTQFLTPADPCSTLTHISLRQTFWQGLVKIQLKLWHLQCLQSFPKIWPGDLVIDPRWPIFILDRYIIKTNDLTKFGEDPIITVKSTVLTWFFIRFDLAT